jgi:energy-coupling factor transport system substrate-specific component
VKTKDIVIIGMMSSIIITLQVVLRFLPNVELVSLFILLFTVIFGRKTLYIIYIFVLVEGFLYGFGFWWFTYLYIWTVLYLIACIFKKQPSAFYFAMISGGFGLCFGALTAIPYFITGGISTGIAYWVQGIPFDVVHGPSNFIITLLLFKPLYLILDKINKQIEHKSE